MKDNKLVKIFLISLLIVMVGLILVSGTYAKYTTKFTGSYTATVANFKVSSNTTAETFDLFKTAKHKRAPETSGSPDKAPPITGPNFFSIKVISKIIVGKKNNLNNIKCWKLKSSNVI